MEFTLKVKVRKFKLKCIYGELQGEILNNQEYGLYYEDITNIIFDLEEFLNEREGKFTKAELSDYLKNTSVGSNRYNQIEFYTDKIKLKPKYIK